MDDRAKKLLEAALQLTQDERARLAHSLLESLRGQEETAPELLADIEAEAQAVLAGKVPSESAERVFELLETKYRR